MKMYNNIILAFVATVVLASCSNNKTIEVNIQNVPAQRVALEEIMGNDFILVDTVKIEEGKPFSMEVELNEERMYRLYFEQDKYIMLALQKGDQLTITGDWNNLENYMVAGSPKSEIVKRLVAGTRENIIDIRTYQRIFDTLEAQGKLEKLKEAQKDYQVHSARFINYIKEFADTTSSAVAALMAVNLINPKMEAPFVAQFYNGIKDRFPQNELVDLYKERFVGSPGISTAPVDTKKGNPAADFQGTTPDGKTVRLQDYRGKYVLIDFWAAWCAPCRKENPNVVAAYNQFKDKNFDVLGISLDTDKNNWLEAIAKDELAWQHISELKGWDCSTAKKYSITSIPANFLIDPDGYIIAKDLRGEALINKLKEVIQ